MFLCLPCCSSSAPATADRERSPPKDNGLLMSSKTSQSGENIFFVSSLSAILSVVTVLPLPKASMVFLPSSIVSFHFSPALLTPSALTQWRAFLLDSSATMAACMKFIYGFCSVLWLFLPSSLFTIPLLLESIFIAINLLSFLHIQLFPMLQSISEGHSILLTSHCLMASSHAFFFLPLFSFSNLFIAILNWL